MLKVWGTLALADLLILLSVQIENVWTFLGSGAACEIEKVGTPSGTLSTVARR